MGLDGSLLLCLPLLLTSLLFHSSASILLLTSGIVAIFLNCPGWIPPLLLRPRPCDTLSALFGDYPLTISMQ